MDLIIYLDSQGILPSSSAGLPTWVPGTCESSPTFRDILGLGLGCMYLLTLPLQRILKVLLWASCICYICFLLLVITDVPLLLGLFDPTSIPSKGIKYATLKQALWHKVYLGLKATEKVAPGRALCALTICLKARHKLPLPGCPLPFSYARPTLITRDRDSTEVSLHKQALLSHLCLPLGLPIYLLLLSCV